MKLSKYTFLAFYLNGAAGLGKYDHITIAKVKENIRAGTIFEYAKKELGDDVDFSVLEPDEREFLINEWQGLVSAVDERRKLCVDRGGLNLLVAYLLEGIQMTYVR